MRATTAAGASPIAWRWTIPRPCRALIPVDILPTAEVWRRTNAERALKSYHWAFLAQPHPMPETLIGKDPVYYLEHTLKSWAKPRDLSPFSAEALAHYRALLQDPARVHAVCEDYRAGATIDRQLDEADLAAGRKIACPTFVLWAQRLPRPAVRSRSGRPGARTSPARRSTRVISSPRKIRRTRWPPSCRSSLAEECDSG